MTTKGHINDTFHKYSSQKRVYYYSQAYKMLARSDISMHTCFLTNYKHEIYFAYLSFLSLTGNFWACRKVAWQTRNVIFCTFILTQCFSNRSSTVMRFWSTLAPITLAPQPDIKMSSVMLMTHSLLAPFECGITTQLRLRIYQTAV